jgi:hypothetical protein
MLSSLHVRRFRAFASLDVEQLSRVSLIVGANSVGKTGILEAVEILLTGGDPWAIVTGPSRRGEGSLAEFSLRHLIHGHSLSVGQSFELQGETTEGRRTVLGEVVHGPPPPTPPSDLTEDQRTRLPERPQGPPITLITRANGDEHGFPLAISPNGTVFRDVMERYVPQMARGTGPVLFQGPIAAVWGWQWDKIQLTQEEANVIDALKIVEPKLERLAALSADRSRPAAFIVAIAGVDRPVPLGTLGDGVRQLLALAVSLSQAAGGTLLVDEIGAGLHHSIVGKMWRLVIETSRRLNVQVIATTHSLDCIRALATVQAATDDISLHRVERGRPKAQRYGPKEIRVAVEHEMELR